MGYGPALFLQPFDTKWSKKHSERERRNSFSQKKANFILFSDRMTLVFFLFFKLRYEELQGQVAPMPSSFCAYVSYNVLNLNLTYLYCVVIWIVLFISFGLINCRIDLLKTHLDSLRCSQYSFKLCHDLLGPIQTLLRSVKTIQTHSGYVNCHSDSVQTC